MGKYSDKKIDKLNKTMSLNNLEVGEEALIIGINTNNTEKIRKLSAFGIMENAEIKLMQKYPAYVIKIGFTKVALDENIASKILVSI